MSDKKFIKLAIFILIIVSIFISIGLLNTTNEEFTNLQESIINNYELILN